MVCTKESSTFTVKMDMVYSPMQETLDLFQAKECKLLLIIDGLQDDLKHGMVNASFIVSINEQIITILCVNYVLYSFPHDHCFIDTMSLKFLKLIVSGYMIHTSQCPRPRS